MCHFTNAPAPLPKQCEYGDSSKVGQKTINLSLPPRYRAKLFLVICCVPKSVNTMAIGNVSIGAQSTSGLKLCVTKKTA